MSERQCESPASVAGLEAGGQPLLPWQEDPWVLGDRPRGMGRAEWSGGESGMMPEPEPGMRWENSDEYLARLIRAMMNPNYKATHPGIGNHIDAVQVPIGYVSPWIPEDKRG